MLHSRLPLGVAALSHAIFTCQSLICKADKNKTSTNSWRQRDVFSHSHDVINFAFFAETDLSVYNFFIPNGLDSNENYIGDESPNLWSDHSIQWKLLDWGMEFCKNIFWHPMGKNIGKDYNSYSIVKWRSFSKESFASLEEVSKYFLVEMVQRFPYLSI